MSAEDSDLCAALLPLRTLERVLRHLEQLKFPLHLMDVVAQDEFSHDVIVPFPAEQKYLALGVT